MRHLTASVLVLLCTYSSAASAGQRPPSPGTSPPPREVPLPRTPPPRTDPVRDEDRKQAQAVRVESGSIRLDGRLDDEAWQRTIPITDFIQAEPVERASTTDHMEIRFVYDDTALWIGARMDSGGAIQAPMSRRDDGDQAEYIQIELDTFLDRRTAYMFGVTASGVRLDHFHPSDNETDVDTQFDPVWEARTNINEHGWTAELWLPFSQLRFNDSPERVWGLNVKRWQPLLNEQDYWVVIGRTQVGWASRFGDLRGIEGVEPKERLEVLPYVSSSSRMTGNRDPNNPFDNGVNLGGRVGADMKVGIGSNLTLEATINPDFGQIEADPAEVNLTVFETIFTERRPFFIEGNSVLVAGTSNYYYSRRIGARPTGTATGDYVDYPDVSTILGAAKLTGRFRTGTSVGFLGAVTDEESASVSKAGLSSSVEVAPRSGWGVGRVIQEFGKYRSTVGAHLTLVHRDLGATDPLAAVLVRNAVTTGVDTRLRFGNRNYEATGNVGLTFLDGEPAAIARVQQASTHYLQRLDQPTVRFDPTRRRLNGLQTTASLNKVGGRHWLWGTGTLMIESPEFDPSDFGRLNYAGDLTLSPRVTYRETQPGRIFRAYSFQFIDTPYWYFDTDLGVRHNLASNNSFTLKNFWVTTLNMTRYLRGLDAQLTRGGPSMGTPLGWSTTGSLRNATGSKTAWSGTLGYKTNEYDERSWDLSGSISARPSPSVQFSVEPEYLNETGTSGIFSGPIGRQYLTTLSGGSPLTYGKRYVFGLVDRTTLSAQFRFNYTFKPDITLDVYAEPFAASGQYRGFGELAAARSRTLRIYGTDGTTISRLADGSYTVTDGASTFALANRDFNNLSFRSNVVLRWEWRPGSTLYAVWQQNRASSVAEGAHVGINDLFGSLSAEGDNIFALKTTIWLAR
jgi:uncharacterized protein DUF5916